MTSEYAVKHGLRVIEEYSDAGLSGTAFGNRPALKQLTDLAEDRGFDVLLIVDLSRLSRSQDLAPFIKRLKHKGVRVIGIQDGFDSTNRTARMQAGMSGIASEEFCAMITDRTHSSLEMRAKEKRPVGGRVYGYSTGHRQIDKEQAAIIRQIFSWSNGGWSHRRIAAALNERRAPSPGSYWGKRVVRRSSGWTGSAIRVMVANPIYRGESRWNTSEWRKDPDSGKRERVERPRDQWVVHREEALRIVTDAVWHAAQRRTHITSNTDQRLKAGGKARYLLSGLMVCGKCGSSYIMGDIRSYACGGFVYSKACDNSIAPSCWPRCRPLETARGCWPCCHGRPSFCAAASPRASMEMPPQRPKRVTSCASSSAARSRFGQAPEGRCLPSMPCTKWLYFKRAERLVAGAGFVAYLRVRVK